jgi:acylphosphatase
MSRVRVEVIGAVQGVGFRWFAREAARRLDLAGWVRNRDDGSVEIAVEGDDAAVERFLAQVERGPRGARVDALRRHPLRPAADADAALSHPFDILR